MLGTGFVIPSIAFAIPTVVAAVRPSTWSQGLWVSVAVPATVAPGVTFTKVGGFAGLGYATFNESSDGTIEAGGSIQLTFPALTTLPFTFSAVVGQEIVTLVPEPGTSGLVGAGVLGVGLLAGGRAASAARRRRRD